MRCDDGPVSAPTSSSARLADQSFTWSASNHAGISSDGIDTLGTCGMMVPAVTINPSANFARAKSRASASVTNVLVRRGCRRLCSVPSMGTSNVTYHVYFIPRGRCSSSVPVLRAEMTATAPFCPVTCKLAYRRTPTRLTPPLALPPALWRTAARATGRAPSTTPGRATQPAG